MLRAVLSIQKDELDKAQVRVTSLRADFAIAKCILATHRPPTLTLASALAGVD